MDESCHDAGHAQTRIQEPPRTQDTHSRRLARAVRSIHVESEAASRQFVSVSRLACPTGCGACCEYPDIHVSVLDCLPMAWSLAERNQLDATLERMEQDRGTQGSTRCPFFTSLGPQRGRCSEYQDRPTVCRLFGSAARIDRTGRAELALCSVLANSAEASEAQALVEQAPVFSRFGHQLAALDQTMGLPLLPIREAMRQALLRVQFESAMMRSSSDGI